MIKEFRGTHCWLSNFAPVEIKGKDRVYPSVEHAYMSAKCDDPNWKDLCAYGGLSAGQIKKQSRTMRP